MKKKDPMQIFGAILALLGVIIILSGLPLQLMSVVSVGPISGEVSEPNATRIIIGTVIFVLGLIAYYGKEGLKMITKK